MRNNRWWGWAFARSLLWFGVMALGLLIFLGAAVGFIHRYLFSLSFISWYQDAGLLVLGAALVVYGFIRGLKGLIDTLSPFTPVNIYEFLQKDVKKRRGPRIVVIGGGTGLSVLLRGLKNYTSNITAIVTVTDDGGSSGRLRGELGVIPPGDIRNCLVALAETETLMDQVFQHRFQEGLGLKGHNLGNLLITALSDITGDFVEAIKQVSKILAVQGQVLPASLEQVVLGARMSDGEVVMGESAITGAGKLVERVFLLPADCRPVPEAVAAIREADAVVLGPGSLYTSIIPNLLVKEIGDAVRETKGVRIFVTNIMTERGETGGYTAAQHVRAILDHIGEGHIQYAIVNDAAIDEERLERYRAEGAEPVPADHSELLNLGVQPVLESLLGEKEVAWHNPDALAMTIMKIIYRRKGLNWSLW